MKATRRKGAEILVGLTLAVAGCNRPLPSRHADGGPDGSGAQGSAGASGIAGMNGAAGTTGSAGVSGSTGVSGGPGTTSGNAGTTGNAGTGGTVAQKQPTGAACQVSSDCNSAICVDGVCCTQACTGSCRSCALPGSVGICIPVPAGSADPRAGCPQESPATCGRTGKCDGSGGCTRWPAGTLCASATCVGDTLTPAATCDAVGMCSTPAAVSCAPFGCNMLAGVCNRGCPAGDSICPVGAYCDGDESCFPQKDAGVACKSNHECKSGFCVDGACCGTACALRCLSCSGSGSLARCTALPSGTICGATSTCDGAGICRTD